MKLKAIRGHFLQGRIVKVGEVYDVDDKTGRELVWSGKADPAPDAPKAPRQKGPMTTETAKPLLGGLED